MILDILKARRSDQPLYVPDVREAFAKEGGRPFEIEAVLYDGGVRRIDLPLPALPREDAERVGTLEALTAELNQFLTDYVCATLYNLLSSVGARSVTIYTDLGDPFLKELAQSLPVLFQVDCPLEERRGYGKCLNVNERVLRSLPDAPKAGFRMRVADLNFSEQNQQGKVPMPKEPQQAAGKSMKDAATVSRKEPEFSLSNLPSRASDKTLLGIDIGGTDIKLAVSHAGRLVQCMEYDWNPAALESAEEFLQPILELTERMLSCIRGGCQGSLPFFDAIGVSFPDVVIHNRIVGGETQKTAGIRRAAVDYEAELGKIAGLPELLSAYLSPGGQVRICNDGTMAAFTSALESACQGTPSIGGFLCHSLGTDLGTGLVGEDGSVPAYPLEAYNFLLDLGCEGGAAYPSEDVRSTRNLGTGLPGSVQRYASQAGIFRLAAGERDKEGVERGFFTWEEGKLLLVPQKRKEALEYYMQEAAQVGSPSAGYFVKIGESLEAIHRELALYLWEGKGPGTGALYGRLVKYPHCIGLLQEGARRGRGFSLTVVDPNRAASPLMRQLAAHPSYTIAQFGQAVGAAYFSLV